MLCIDPDSLNVTGNARRFAAVVVPEYTSVLPKVLLATGDADCVTVTILSATPVPVIVTVAIRETIPALAELAVTVIVPLFEPETGDTLSQSESSLILQLVFDVILNVPFDPDSCSRDIPDGVTDNVNPAPVVYVQ